MPWGVEIMDARCAMALRAPILNLGALAVAECIRVFENIRHVGIAGYGVEAWAVVFAMKEHGRGIAQRPEDFVLAPLREKRRIQQVYSGFHIHLPITKFFFTALFRVPEDPTPPDQRAMRTDALDLGVARCLPRKADPHVGDLLCHRAEYLSGDLGIYLGPDLALSLQPRQPPGRAAPESVAFADPHRIETCLFAARRRFTHHAQKLAVARIVLEKGDGILDELGFGQPSDLRRTTAA